MRYQMQFTSPQNVKIDISFSDPAGHAVTTDTTSYVLNLAKNPTINQQWWSNTFRFDINMNVLVLSHFLFLLILFFPC